MKSQKPKVQISKNCGAPAARGTLLAFLDLVLGLFQAP